MFDKAGDGKRQIDAGIEVSETFVWLEAEGFCFGGLGSGGWIVVPFSFDGWFGCGRDVWAGARLSDMLAALEKTGEGFGRVIFFGWFAIFFGAALSIWRGGFLRCGEGSGVGHGGWKVVTRVR